MLEMRTCFKHAACANGFEIRLLGLFFGSLLVCVSPNYQSIDVVIQANTPDLGIVTEVFRKTLSADFKKCILNFLIFFLFP